MELVSSKQKNSTTHKLKIGYEKQSHLLKVAEWNQDFVPNKNMLNISGYKMSTSTTLQSD